MKRIKTCIIFVLNWLKDRNNLILVLLFVLTLSIFKIAFYGIDTYSLINSDNPLNIDGSVELPKETTVNIKTNMDDPYDDPLYIHIETLEEQYERYKKIEYLYNHQQKEKKKFDLNTATIEKNKLDVKPVSEPQRETP